MDDTARSVRLVPITGIVVDAGTQVRAAADDDAIEDYARAMQAGAEFPPVALVHDGRRYYLADGFHRVLAATRIGRAEILAEVRIGSVQDAVWFALGANRIHGLRLTTEDKRNAVDRVLREFSDKSLRDVAEHVGCSPEFVRQRKAQVSTVDTCSPAHVTGRDGKHYPATRKATPKPEPAEPELPTPAAAAAPAPSPAPSPAPVAPVDASEDDSEPMPPAVVPSLACVDDDGPHDGELPCPFCGATTAVGVENRGLKRSPAFVVHCWECEATGPYIGTYGKSRPYDPEAMKLEAVRLWNAAPRPAQTPQDASEPATRPDAAPPEPVPVDGQERNLVGQLWAVVKDGLPGERVRILAALDRVKTMLGKDGAR